MGKKKKKKSDLQVMTCVKKSFILKAVFNIVEDWFEFFLNFDVCFVFIFRRINKQPGMQKLWKWCSHYQEIYDWLSFNKQSGLSFILTHQSMGDNEYGQSGHLSIFILLKHFHLMMLLKCIFSGLNFSTLSKTLIACRAMQLRFS